MKKLPLLDAQAEELVKKISTLYLGYTFGQIVVAQSMCLATMCISNQSLESLADTVAIVLSTYQEAEEKRRRLES